MVTLADITSESIARQIRTRQHMICCKQPSMVSPAHRKTLSPLSMSAGGSVRRQPTLNAFLSQSDSGRKGSNTKLTSGKGTSGEVSPAFSAKMYTNKEIK